MIRYLLLLLVAVVACVLVGRCGSGGSSTIGGGSGTEVVPIGPVRAEVKTATGAFKARVVESPPDSPVAFTVLYGAEVVRLQEVGYTKLAFHSTADGDSDIYTIDITGGNRKKLTRNTTNDRDPDWSPNGKMIAFHRSRGGPHDIFVMDADGGNERPVTHDAAPDFSPEWCPVPSVHRSYAGGGGSDGGDDPPFGASTPLAVIGLGPDAAWSRPRRWSSPSCAGRAYG